MTLPGLSSCIGWDAWPQLTSVWCVSPDLVNTMFSLKQTTSIGGGPGRWSR
jgi:hypothetical protein